MKRADRLYPAPNYCSRGSRQRSWMPGLAKPDQEGKQEANGGKLAFIRAVQAFPCHGAVVGRDNQTWRIAIVGRCTHQKASP